MKSDKRVLRRIARAGPARSSPRGSVLALTLVVSLILVLTLAAAVSTTTTNSKNAQYALDQTGALALAEGTTEAAQKKMLKDVANFKPPILKGTVDIGGAAYPFNIVPIGAAFNRTDTDGVTMVIQPYQVSSTVESGTATTTVKRVVELTMTPLFQYMIFYQNDLEILPGPDMTLSGRIHSNASIYLSAGNNLTIDSNYLRATGDILRKRKDDGSEGTGTVQIKVNGTSTFATMSTKDDSENPNWVNLALSTWKGTVESGAHGVKEVAAPSIGSIKATDPATSQNGYYRENAGLVIVNQTAYDHSGNVLSLPAGTISEKTMYDAREGKNVTVTELNVGLLNGSGAFPANGLVYAYRTDASSLKPNGIRLANAREIALPLTFVSEDPVYLKGDFNTVNKKGAAVMSDAVNFLSNAWNDKKTAGSLPVAAATQYNLAIVTGKVPTPDGGGSYSGGFENLPRFHENWTGVKATIRGAFINIFESEIAKSKWVYGGDKYTAPTRDWQYDTALNDPRNLPPFTPNAVYFQRVLWDDGLASPLP
jgi:hypothetical protein